MGGIGRRWTRFEIYRRIADLILEESSETFGKIFIFWEVSTRVLT